ncbi:nickel/cobalt transporter [Tianweitania sediminis]|uniref:Nickel/cobalt efflux system n=1 Tax=Tianweitania sediminis TaxID=1502156 RepID=A0A8J7R5E2_9HYPH|nr:nickel/cobalt transporter [Tianweitania sediminis]MBP0441271.1 nickel/cobalt transporter [Tianweitania sediminis]
MIKTFLRCGLALLVVAFALTHILGAAHAQSSLGIGTAEPSIAPTGLLAGLFQWINTHQQAFYRSMTAALKGMRDDTGQLWLLIGLSFAYGIFHAAGPGHGKVVIASYMLANDVALRRGIALSVVSSLLQAVSAIIVIGAVFLFLRGTAFSMTDATHWLEVASFALVAVYGGWLLWRKLHRFLPVLMPRQALATAGGPLHDLFDAQPPCASGVTSQGRAATPLAASRFQAAEANPGEIRICEDCGQSHAVDPAALGDERLDWRSAWAAVLAVGIRPCSGALIVLTFSLLNGLWFGGIVSVFAMAVGTAVTVAALAILAVSAKHGALAMAGGGKIGTTLHVIIEIAGAAALLLIGLLLLGASLSA